MLLALALLACGLAAACAPPAARAYRDRQAGNRAYVKRDYRQAYERYASAVTAASKLVNVEGPGEEALTYYNLGLSLEKLGNYTLERDVMERAHELAKRSGDKNTALLAEKSLAEAEGFRGDYPRSIDLLEALIPRAKEMPSGVQASLHRSLAVAAGALGDFERQKQEAEVARELSAKASDRDGEAAARILLASYHAARGEHERGLALLDEAQKLLEQSREPDLTPLYLARGDLHRGRGEYRQALAADMEALKVARASKVEEAEAVALSRLGIDHFVLGDLERARTRFSVALQIHEAVGATDDQAQQLYYLGKLAGSRKNWTESVRRLSQARSLYQTQSHELGGAVCDLALSEALRESGQPLEALERARAAGAVFVKTGEVNGQAESAIEESLALTAAGRQTEAAAAAGRATSAADPDLRWRAAYALGLALEGSGRAGEAANAYSQAAEELERLRQDLKLASLQSGYSASRAKLAVYQRLVGLLARQGRMAEAFDASERARARAFLDQLGNRAVAIGASAAGPLLAEERALGSRIAELTGRLQQGYAAPDATRLGPALEKLASQIDELRRQHQEKVDAIALQDPRIADLVAIRPLGLAQVQAKLPAGTTLLEYFVTESALHTWVVTRGSARMAVTTVRAEELIDHANLFRVALEQNLPLADDVGRKLHGWLIEPVAGELSAEQVWIVPHLGLHYVPFAALTGPDGKYLVERHAFATLPSASFLALEESTPPKAPATLLALGNPMLETTSEDLPFAGQEVEQIQGQFQSRVLLREQATEARLRAALAEPPAADLLHLACHADLDPVNPLFSAMLLGKGDGHDGELTVQEVYGLKLSASLVVLSACDTAMGPVSQGDELVGLMRAFKGAGARAVVASLWEINDEASAQLMKKLYEGLRGAVKPEALRQAQLELLRAPYGPHYWAPFVWQGSQ